jgi:cell division protein FtsQ
MWNKILHIGSWSAGIILLFVLLGASMSASNRAMLADVKVQIDFGEGNFFIDKDEVVEVVNDLGYLKDSTLMINLDSRRIEHVLENNAFIHSAEVYEQLNGVLNVDVKVRQPILRVYTQTGQSVYLDEEGKFMPLSSQYAARTPITNGYISVNLKSLVGKDINQIADSLEHPDLTVIRELFLIVTECRKDPFWKAQFNQFYVNASHEIEMIPRVGDHIVLVGNAKDIEKKLNKLRLFYSKGLNKTGWNEYRTINLKYANQVVCSKS